MKIFSPLSAALTLFCMLGMVGVGGYWYFFVRGVVQYPSAGVSFDLKNLEGKKNIIPVAIIGSGAAGLSAGLYTSRAHLHTVIFGGPQAGGQLMSTTEVENWPGMGKKHGPDIMHAVQEQTRHFGAVILDETIKKVNFSVWPYELTLGDDTITHALCVIVCTGAHPERLKNVPGENEHFGKGVTACAICDAAFFKDKDVVVVGGGDSAAEQALQLTAYARHITLLVRGEKMRASVAMQDRLKKFDYINIRYNTSITEIEGDGTRVTGVKLKTAQGDDHMDIDGVFLAIGHKPNTELFKGQLELTPHGYIAHTCRTQETSHQGVFAAGDVSDERYRQAAVASGDGIKAALDAERFLQHIGFDELFSKKVERKFYDPVTVENSIEIPEITSMEQFKQLVLESKTPVILDFYTKFCSSCAHMLPSIQAVAAQLKDKVTCVKIDIEKMAELKDRYMVTTVPYFIVIKDGLVVGRYNDVMTKREFFDFASRFIAE